MSAHERRFVVLLRGINVGGRHKLPMAGLRSVCDGLGCEAVRTCIQSGNVVLRSAVPADSLERLLEQAIGERFGFSVPVIVRTSVTWGGYVRDNPFPQESTAGGNRVVLALSKARPEADAVSALQSRATGSERVVLRRDAIWIYYASGIARSRISPDVLDRCVGSPVTARNWRTVAKLQEMLVER